MDRFKNILVAASPGHLEPNMLQAAIDFAETNSARLTVLDVVESMTRMRRFLTAGRRTVDVHAELSRHRSERLRLLAEGARTGDDPDLAVVEGEPFIEVIRHALEHDNDLVIVGGGAVKRRSTPHLPSGVMHLLRKCPAPVWVMRPRLAGTFRILALIDPDPDDHVRDGLNDLVLSLATSLANRADGELHVGHSWELAGEATLRSSPHVSLGDEDVDVLAETAEGVHREHLGALLGRHGAAESGAEVHLVEGHAGEVLPKLAKDLGIGLIVMGTVARTGISGVIIGNTAETILHSVNCSVLAVKPEGFVTPVKPAKERGRAPDDDRRPLDDRAARVRSAHPRPQPTRHPTGPRQAPGRQHMSTGYGTTSMHRFIANNQRFADQYDYDDLAVEPSARLAIVTGMDSRMDIFQMLGLNNGQAHIIRNAGGVVTDDVIRSLCLSQRVLGTRSIMLIHNSDSVLARIDEAQFKAELEAEVGIKPWWSLETFSDPYADVRQSMHRIHMTPFIPHKGNVRGFVYDVTTGQLHEVTLDDSTPAEGGGEGD